MTLLKSNFFNSAKTQLSIFAGSLLLPISTFAVTVLFLALGGFLASLDSKSWFGWVNVGYLFMSFSYPILSALPLLLCISFAITYNKNDAFAVWCAVIAFLVFNMAQSPFINVVNSGGGGGNFPKVTVWFPGPGRDSINLVHSIFGFNTLNTSFFSSFIIGGLFIPWLLKNKSNIELPKYISFFSGKRLLPLLSGLYMVPLAIGFIIFWPYINFVITKFGMLTGKLPFGIDSFIFGLCERIMVPFGLHHAFYAPLWYTSLGGDMIDVITGDTNIFTSGPTVNVNLPKNSTEFLASIIQNSRGSYTSFQGDSFMGITAIAIPDNKISNKPIFQYFASKNLNIGRFTAGKYPAMQFGLPAAGLAMIYAAPKKRRKEAMATIIPAILTSFILGITEPLEFLFLYQAPKLFFLFHAPMMGLAFMLMNIFGAHVVSAFSGGIIEFIIFGIIPVLKGTGFYWWIVVGAIIAPIYFIVFYLYILFTNLETPGREKVQNTNKTEEVVSESKVPSDIRKLVIAFGGWENIETAANCASRLRYIVKDKSKVNEAMLKEAGVIAVKWVSDVSVQAIVGPKAESINTNVLKWMGEDLHM